MKRTAYVGLVLLFVLMATYAVWIQSPEEQDTVALSAALHQVDERFEELQKQAQDPDLNGYLHESFLDYWSVRGGPERSPARSAIEAMAAYHEMGSEVLSRQAERVLQEDEEFLTAVSAFELWLPELIRAWSKPVFTVPLQNWNGPNRTPRLAALRNVSKAMVAFAQVRLAQGRSSDALVALETPFLIGRSLIDQGLLSSQIEGDALQSLAFEGVVESLDPFSHLTGAEWLILGRTLTSSLPPADAFHRSLLGELYIFERMVSERNWAGVRHLEQGRLLLWVTALPGMLDRERRLLRIAGNEYLERALAQDIEGLPESVEFSFTDWILGRNFLLAALEAPNLRRAAANTSLNRYRLLGLALACNLIAYRSQFGSYPENLEQLAKMGVTPFLGYESEAERFLYEGRETQATLTVLLPEGVVKYTGGESRRIIDSSLFYRFREDRLVFEL